VSFFRMNFIRVKKFLNHSLSHNGFIHNEKLRLRLDSFSYFRKTFITIYAVMWDLRNLFFLPLFSVIITFKFRIEQNESFFSY
jgi:hypothetical protein